MEPTHQAEGSALQLTNIEEDKYEEEQLPSSLPEESGAHHPQVGIHHPYLLFVLLFLVDPSKQYQVHKSLHSKE